MTIHYFNPERRQIDISELAKYEKGGSIFTDYRRSRPRWFDGRFLKATDLNRETSYFLTRQADLAVAAGTGVVEGLQVAERSATQLRIARGHGMTFDGERVFLPRDVDIRLHDIPLAEQLNVTLGLSRRPAPPDRSRSGIYVLALRPLEFTANPTAAYPVDVDGERQLRDGDIVEATAVTLVPLAYPSGASTVPALRRALIAHEVFTEQAPRQVPTATLPLAVLEMRRGRILWLDNHLVRRETGAVHSDVLGFGFAPRALRRAHFKQYDEMIDDIAGERRRAGAGLRFSAAEYFVSLPSAGRLPRDSIDLDSLTQHYFPDTMDVEMSIIPEDEMAALIEESLLLPPILLGENDADTFAGTSVLILLPVARRRYFELAKQARRAPAPTPMPTGNIRSRFAPRDYVNAIRSRLPDFTPPAPREEEQLKQVPWKALAAGETFLWFVRRRNLSYKDAVAGTAIHIMAREHEDETEMRARQRQWGLYRQFVDLKVVGSAAADLEMVRLLTIPRITQSEILMRSALKEFEARKEHPDGSRWAKLDEKAASEVSIRFGERQFGKGIARLEDAIALRRQRIKLAESLRAPELDQVARALDEGELAAFAGELVARLDDDQQSAAQIGEFILAKKKELES